MTNSIDELVMEARAHAREGSLAVAAKYGPGLAQALADHAVNLGINRGAAWELLFRHGPTGGVLEPLASMARAIRLLTAITVLSCLAVVVLGFMYFGWWGVAILVAVPIVYIVNVLANSTGRWGPAAVTIGACALGLVFAGSLGRSLTAGLGVAFVVGLWAMYLLADLAVRKKAPRSPNLLRALIDLDVARLTEG